MKICQKPRASPTVDERSSNRRNGLKDPAAGCRLEINTEPLRRTIDYRSLCRPHGLRGLEENLLGPIPLVVAQCIASYRSTPPLGRPLMRQTFADSRILRVSETQSVPRSIRIRSPVN